MSQEEIDLLQHELLLRGVNVKVSPHVYHMEYNKALDICLDVYAGFTFKDAIETYDERKEQCEIVVQMVQYLK